MFAKTTVDKGPEGDEGNLTISSDNKVIKCKVKGPAALYENEKGFEISSGPLTKQWGSSWFCPRKVKLAELSVKKSSNNEDQPGSAFFDLGTRGRYQTDAEYQCHKEKNGSISCDVNVQSVHFNASFKKNSH